MAFRFSLLLIPLFFMSCGSGLQKPDKDDSPYVPPVKIDTTRKGLVYPKLMAIVRKSAYDNYYVRIGDSVYDCSYKGVITSSDTLRTTQSFIADLQAEYLIDRVYFQPLNSNQFFVTWQETDHTGVSSYFALYNRGSSKAVWEEKIKAPGPGQPAIDSASVYVSSMGMIAKFGLYSGETIWKHDSLFDPYKLIFKQFEKPILYKHTACFFDIPVRGKKARQDTLWVNESDGRLRR